MVLLPLAEKLRRVNHFYKEMASSRLTMLCEWLHTYDYVWEAQWILQVIRKSVHEFGREQEGKLSTWDEVEGEMGDIIKTDCM